MAKKIKSNQQFFHKFHIKRQPISISLREQLENFWLQNTQEEFLIEYSGTSINNYCTLKKKEKNQYTIVGIGTGNDPTEALLDMFIVVYDHIDIMDRSHIRSFFQWPTEGNL